MRRNDYERSDFGLHGRLKERRFDLPDYAPTTPSPQDRATAAFLELSQDEQDQLQGWLVASIKPATPRRGAFWEPRQNVLSSRQLAAEASEALGWPVGLHQLNGALLGLGYRPVLSTANGPDWAVGAVRKES